MQWIDGNTFFGTWPKRELDVPAEMLVRLLKEAEVSRALTLCLAAPLLEAKEGSDLTRLASVEHRELIPFGSVDPRRYTGGEEVARLRSSGTAAIRITNGINGFGLDISPVQLILGECAAAELTAFVDVTAWGQATVCERLAKTSGCRIVMCGPSYFILSECLVSMNRSKWLHLETSKLNTPDAVRIACAEVGAERVLFGSGAPFNYVAGARMVARHNDLTDDELSWVSSRTVLSLLSPEYRP